MPTRDDMGRNDPFDWSAAAQSGLSVVVLMSGAVVGLTIAFGAYGFIGGTLLATLSGFLYAIASDKAVIKRYVRTKKQDPISHKSAITILNLLENFGDARRKNLPLRVIYAVKKFVTFAHHTSKSLDGRDDARAIEFVNTYLKSVDDILVHASAMYKRGSFTAEDENEIIGTLSKITNSFKEIDTEFVEVTRDRLQEQITFIEERLKIDDKFN